MSIKSLQFDFSFPLNLFFSSFAFILFVCVCLLFSWLSVCEARTNAYAILYSRMHRFLHCFDFVSWLVTARHRIDGKINSFRVFLCCKLNSPRNSADAGSERRNSTVNEELQEDSYLNGCAAEIPFGPHSQFTRERVEREKNDEFIHIFLLLDIDFCISTLPISVHHFYVWLRAFVCSSGVCSERERPATARKKYDLMELLLLVLLFECLRSQFSFVFIILWIYRSWSPNRLHTLFGIGCQHLLVSVRSHVRHMRGPLYFFTLFHFIETNKFNLASPSECVLDVWPSHQIRSECDCGGNIKRNASSEQIYLLSCRSRVPLQKAFFLQKKTIPIANK